MMIGVSMSVQLDSLFVYYICVKIKILEVGHPLLYTQFKNGNFVTKSKEGKSNAD